MSNSNTAKITEGFGRLDAKIAMFADGFVDEVWEVVSSRASLSEYSLYTKMGQFAERISGTGGVGLELVRKRRAPGGFAANIGYAAARLGVDTSMVDVYGKEIIDPVFDDVNKLCRVFSVDDPAVTHVLEFDDGKVLMSYMASVQNITWKQITDRVGMDKLTAMIGEADMIGVGYWSLLPSFDEIVSEIAANLPSGKKTRFFFDFADFKKRDEASLNASMQKLRLLNDRFPMTLSVNEHEAAALFAIYGETLDEKTDAIPEKTERVRKQIGLDELVVHTPYYGAAASSSNKPALAASVYCEKPVRSAGAGDSFNGGYIAASLAGFNTPERLEIANASVGAFLRSGVYPDRRNMLEYMGSL